MSSWRIREIENDIENLERKLRTCSERERYDIQRKIDDLKSELRRLKRREEEDDDDDGFLGLSLISGSIFGSGSHSGGHFGGFGGGGFGGGGAGGSW